MSSEPHVTTGTAQHSLDVQTWHDFDSTAGESVPCLINGLWPEGAQGMIGAAPKAGKTWLGLEIGVSVATGTPVFGSFPVPHAQPVLYVALEGHRAAIRARIGCIARGHGIQDPLGDGLPSLHIAYKPKGINLADGAWADTLISEAREFGAGLVIVDVLRRAARIKENDPGGVHGAHRPALPARRARHQPRAAAPLHQGEQETKRQRRPASAWPAPARCSARSTSACSSPRARTTPASSRSTRTSATSPRPTVHRHPPGRRQRTHGGFTYRDELRLMREDADPDDALKGAKPLDIKRFVIEQGGGATPGAIRSRFGLKDQGLRHRRDRLRELGIDYIKAGKNSHYEARESAQTREPATPRDTSNHGVGEAHPATPPPYRAGRGDRGDDSGVSSDQGTGIDHGAYAAVPDEVLDRFSVGADEYYDDAPVEPAPTSNLPVGAWHDGNTLANEVIDASMLSRSPSTATSARPRVPQRCQASARVEETT